MVAYPDRGEGNDLEPFFFFFFFFFFFRGVGSLSQPRLNIFTVDNMGVMICLGQGGLRSLSASSSNLFSKKEFLTPKYPRIEVLVMIVAPQDQFYIETNLANCSFIQFVQYAHKKTAQSCCSSNKAKFAYLPTPNTVPSKKPYT